MAPSTLPQFPDELLIAIFRQLLPDGHNDYSALYRLCLASKRFCSIAQPLLWKEIAIVVPPLPADFAEHAQMLGVHTRKTAFTVSDPDLLGLARQVCKRFKSLKVLELEKAGPRMRRSVFLYEWGKPGLKHLAIGVPVLLNPSARPLSNLVSLDFATDAHAGCNFSGYLVPRQLPCLRALAIKSTGSWSAALDSDFLRQLDCLQVLLQDPAPATLANFGHHVPLLLCTPGFADKAHASAPNSGSAFHFNIDITGPIEIVIGGLFRMAEEPASTAMGRSPRSIWFPSVVQVDEMMNDSSLSRYHREHLHQALAVLEGSAREEGIPVRRHGESGVVRETRWGTLSWDFWEYAKELRARGTT
ncbi:F-box protein [Rhodotorula paludigena]|uniref:F-box protein n=1 Tax=Rhodotorula paludigena TaxID=86838 RepID=UPI0031705E67